MILEAYFHNELELYVCISIRPPHLGVTFIFPPKYSTSTPTTNVRIIGCVHQSTNLLLYLYTETHIYTYIYVIFFFIYTHIHIHIHICIYTYLINVIYNIYIIYIYMYIHRYKIIYKNTIYLRSRIVLNFRHKIFSWFQFAKKVSLDGDKLWRSRTKKFKSDYGYVI